MHFCKESSEKVIDRRYPTKRRRRRRKYGLRGCGESRGLQNITFSWLYLSPGQKPVARVMESTQWRYFACEQSIQSNLTWSNKLQRKIKAETRNPPLDATTPSNRRWSRGGPVSGSTAPPRPRFSCLKRIVANQLGKLR